ncbi:MAG: DNA helicase PcrA [bacterium]|nr:DNA helicase PcrA [bacterium]
MSIYDSLNPEQRRAVEHVNGPLLLLAGAGSGKTRVLTHRIAYLIDEVGVNPWNILAITFTNKAAKEMRERVDKIVGYGSENIWVSTFHSTCVRILRRHIEKLGYEKSFTIYDSDDQKSLMKDVIKYLDLDPKNWKEKACLGAISSAKDDLLSPDEFEREAGAEYKQRKMAEIYREYQKRLKANNALDFDDLIVLTCELFRTCPDVLHLYRQRFRYIMVDEYQDTNTAQFKLIEYLATSTNEDGDIEHNICVVGDDDQSIYKFRGANIHNILNFEKVYANTNVIKLEQNYRSTQNILNAANEVIANNFGRKDKTLWTSNPEGDLVHFTQYENEYEEADQIVSDIYNKIRNDGVEYKDFAILYRTNAQSRIFEEKLIRNNIPYKIVGAVNFYQRKEIKDLLCYLKTIDNGADDISVKRIINVPRRGIGLTTIDRVLEYSMNNDISFYAALKHAEVVPGLARAVAKISPFVSMIEILKQKSNDPKYSLEDLVNEVLEATGYLADLEAEDTEEAKGRIENIQELLNKVIAYEANCDDIPTLSGFLEEVALVADIDNLEESNDVVVLMTLHSAKGLEFPYVYLCGMEDGLFPSYMSINGDDPTEVEEERRLCYVGITRAMKELSLSCARSRMVRGETQFNKPSRFIREIPRHLVQESVSSRSRNAYGSKFGSSSSSSTFRPTQMESSIPRATSNDPKNLFANNPFISKGFGSSAPSMTAFDKPAPGKREESTSVNYEVGDTVKHMKFGTGVVKTLIAKGTDYEVTVEFENSGMKKMLASFARLKKVQ